MSQLTGAENDPLWDVLIKFGITIVVLFIVIRLIYFRFSHKERTVFSFFQMGIMIFLVCILLQHVEIQLGVALGLFAIFAILRFRSEGLSLRDMTYFFTVIGIGVINAMASFYNPVRGIVLVNSIIILSALILELFFNKRSLSSATLVYDKLDLLDDSRKKELLDDLSSRTRKIVVKTIIKKYDLIKNSAELEIYYKNQDTSGE
jgi:hypothetical protein